MPLFWVTVPTSLGTRSCQSCLSFVCCLLPVVVQSARHPPPAIERSEQRYTDIWLRSVLHIYIYIYDRYRAQTYESLRFQGILPLARPSGRAAQRILVGPWSNPRFDYLCMFSTTHIHGTMRTYAWFEADTYKGGPGGLGLGAPLLSPLPPNYFRSQVGVGAELRGSNWLVREREREREGQRQPRVLRESGGNTLSPPGL